MKHKKIILTSILTLSLFTSFAYATEKKETNEKEQLSDVKFYDTVTETVFDDPAANKISKKYFSFYSKYVKQINKEMDKYKTEILNNIQDEKKDGEKIKLEQNELYEKNCKDVKEEKDFNQCQAIKENIFNINEKIKELEVEIKNQKGQLETDRLNRLKKTYIDYKNRIGKLKAQVEANKN